MSSLFGLQQNQDADFFPEWRLGENGGVTLSSLEEEILDRIKANFTSLMDRPPLLENSVKMVVLAPLLDLLGFYQPPFSIQTEPSIEITAEDEGITVRGRIDILVLKNRLWLTVIESKRSDFSVTRAIPQTLSYLLSNPDSPTFGLIHQWQRISVPQSRSGDDRSRPDRPIRKLTPFFPDQPQQ
jgi:hypothetical protein